jgi:hypothetical protein
VANRYTATLCFTVGFDKRPAAREGKKDDPEQYPETCPRQAKLGTFLHGATFIGTSKASVTFLGFCQPESDRRPQAASRQRNGDNRPPRLRY